MINPSLLSRAWPEAEFVAFDTETSGKYPLSAELCEFAAVRWRAGEVVSRWAKLIKPSQPMSPENVAIHGISNAMVENAPPIAACIGEIRATLDGAIGIAHHAPFDMGFLAHEFERAGLALPEESAICSSLLARKVLPESANHRLQTLIAHLGLAQGMAHRATDDAEACLGVALRCMERMGRQRSIADIFAEQGGALEWPRFSMLALRENPIVAELIAAAERRGAVEAVYLSGSTPGASRLLYPEGVVRSLDGDYLVAYSAKGQRSKRYLLERIASARAL